MDPNVTLNDIRKFCHEPDFENPEWDVEDLIEAFMVLDNWLSNGGFLPNDWSKNECPICHGEGTVTTKRMVGRKIYEDNVNCSCKEKK